MTSPDPWSKLPPDEARRVSATGQFDFFWVTLELGMPGLMLRLPQLPDPLPELPKLKNLSVCFRTSASAPAFVLALKEQSQVEIFETLCRDVVSACESADSIDHALNRAIQRTRRWHHLLRGGSRAGLSIEEQRGLVGELAVLRELIAGLGPDAAIDAWKGPSRATKDFEFIGTCIEVKTRRVAAKPFVSISSAEQLADVEGCRLFMRIVNVASAVTPVGQSLHDHVEMTAQLFAETVTAIDDWEVALYDYGYDPENDYGGRRWQLGEVKTYEVIDDFPRIAVPLPTGIEMVKYALSIEACARFEKEIDLVEVIRDGLENG